MTGWSRWHTSYDDPSSALSARLAVVQSLLRAALDQAPPRPLRLLSLLLCGIFGNVPDDDVRRTVRAVPAARLVRFDRVLS